MFTKNHILHCFKGWYWFRETYGITISYTICKQRISEIFKMFPNILFGNVYIFLSAALFISDFLLLRIFFVYSCKTFIKKVYLWFLHTVKKKSITYLASIQ